MRFNKQGWIYNFFIKGQFHGRSFIRKKIIKLYTEIEFISKENIGLIDFHGKRELISFGIVGEYFTKGFIVLIKAVIEELIFIAISPMLISSNLILTEFDKVVDEFSTYFSEAKNQGILNTVYNII